MKRKILYGCLAGIVIFAIASVVAAKYNYGYELYLIGMSVCGILSLVLSLCKSHLLINTVVFVVAFLIILLSYLFGALLFGIAGLVLIIGWIFVERVCLKA